MALQYSYFTGQEDLARQAVIRVYSYETCPSREKRLGDRDRYPSVYKLFNNKPCFGDANATGAHTSPHPDVGTQTHVAAHPNAYPKTVESVNYHDTGRLSSSPRRSPQPQAELVGNKSQAPVPFQHHVAIAHPIAYPKTVESVNYYDTGRSSPSAHDKARLEGRRKEISRRDDNKQEGDHPGEEQCVDAAAAGFIEWKRRNLKMCN